MRRETSHDRSRDSSGESSHAMGRDRRLGRGSSLLDRYALQPSPPRPRLIETGGEEDQPAEE